MALHMYTFEEPKDTGLLLHQNTVYKVKFSCNQPVSCSAVVVAEMEEALQVIIYRLHNHLPLVKFRTEHFTVETSLKLWPLGQTLLFKRYETELDAFKYVVHLNFVVSDRIAENSPALVLRLQSEVEHADDDNRVLGDQKASSAKGLQQAIAAEEIPEGPAHETTAAHKINTLAIEKRQTIKCCGPNRNENPVTQSPKERAVATPEERSRSKQKGQVNLLPQSAAATKILRRNIFSGEVSKSGSPQRTPRAQSQGQRAQSQGQRAQSQGQRDKCKVLEHESKKVTRNTMDHSNKARTPKRSVSDSDTLQGVYREKNLSSDAVPQKRVSRREYGPSLPKKRRDWPSLQFAGTGAKRGPGSEECVLRVPQRKRAVVPQVEEALASASQEASSKEQRGLTCPVAKQPARRDKGPSKQLSQKGKGPLKQLSQEQRGLTCRVAQQPARRDQGQEKQLSHELDSLSLSNSLSHHSKRQAVNSSVEAEDVRLQELMVGEDRNQEIDQQQAGIGEAESCQTFKQKDRHVVEEGEAQEELKLQMLASSDKGMQTDKREENNERHSFISFLFSPLKRIMQGKSPSTNK